MLQLYTEDNEIAEAYSVICGQYTADEIKRLTDTQV